MDSDKVIDANFFIPLVVNKAPLVTWTSTPGTVSSGAGYTVGAHATDDGNLDSLVVRRNGTLVTPTQSNVGFSSGDISFTTSDVGVASGNTTVTYTATATDKAGLFTTITQEVIVQPPVANALDGWITATVSAATAPGSVKLGWGTTNATSATVTGPNGFNASALSGSPDIANLPAGTYTYTLNATGANGTTLQRQTTFTITAATVLSAWITANPNTGTAPASTTVSWGSSNATAVSVTTSAYGGATLGSTVSGSQACANLAAGTHTFTITAEGPGGPVTQSATFVVAAGGTGGGGPISRNMTSGFYPSAIPWQGGSVAIRGDNNVAGPGRLTLYKLVMVTGTTEEWDNETETWVTVPTTTYQPQQYYQTAITMSSGIDRLYGYVDIPVSSQDGRNIGWKVNVTGTDSAGGFAEGGGTQSPIPPARQQSVAVTPTTFSAMPGETVSLTASGGNTGYVWNGSTTQNAASATFTVPSGAMPGESYTVTVFSPAGGVPGDEWAQSNFASAKINVGVSGQAGAFKLSLLAPPRMPYVGGSIDVQIVAQQVGSVTGSVTTASEIIAGQALGTFEYGVAPGPAVVTHKTATLPINLSATPRTYTVRAAITSTAGSPVVSQQVIVDGMPSNAPPAITIDQPPTYYWDGWALWSPGGGMWTLIAYSPGRTATVTNTVSFADGSARATRIRVPQVSAWSSEGGVGANVQTYGFGDIDPDRLPKPVPLGTYHVRATITNSSGQQSSAEASGRIVRLAIVSTAFDAPGFDTGQVEIDPDTGEEVAIYDYPDAHGWSVGWTSPGGGGWLAAGDPVHLVCTPGTDYKFVRWHDDTDATVSYNLTADTVALAGSHTYSAELVLAGQPDTPVTFSASPLSFVYDGTPKAPTVTPSLVGLPFSTSGTASATPVGTYTATVSTLPGTAFRGSQTYSWTIGPKPVAFTFADLSPLYDGARKPATVTPGDSAATYTVRYTGTNGTLYGPSTLAPTEVGTYAVSVAAHGNYSGTGSATLSIRPIPVLFTFGNVVHVYDGTSRPVEVTASVPAATYTVTYVGAAGTTYPASNVAPSNAGTYAVTASAEGVYTGTGAATLLIGQAEPTVTWAAPAAITYGAALGPLQLNATASVQGSFAYSPYVGSVPASGDQILSATFAPADSANYRSKSATVTLAVKKAALTVTAQDQSMNYGAPLPALTYTTTGFVNGETAGVLAGAAAVSTDATTVSGVGRYVISVARGTLTAANYDFKFVAGQLTVLGRPVTFSFRDLSHVYDGSAKRATVAASESGASYSAFLDGGPDAGSYPVTVVATGNYSGSAGATLVIAPSPQTIVLTPASATIPAGAPVDLHASGGRTGYAWTGAVATGTPDSAVATFATPGTYQVTVVSPAGRNYLPSNTATAGITVVPNRRMTSFTPLESAITITDPASPMNGQTYRRIWPENGWTAYLGRPGVRFLARGEAWPAVKSVEMQAQPPGGNWAALATQPIATAETNAEVTFSVMLGDSAPNQPLVPLSFMQGSPQTGTWKFRARLQDANGSWSSFSDEVSVQVVLPLVTRTISGQTVPPAGPLGAWFTASPVQAYSIPLWIP